MGKCRQRCHPSGCHPGKGSGGCLPPEQTDTTLDTVTRRSANAPWRGPKCLFVTGAPVLTFWYLSHTAVLLTTREFKLNRRTNKFLPSKRLFLDPPQHNFHKGIPPSKALLVLIHGHSISSITVRFLREFNLEEFRNLSILLVYRMLH